MYFQRKLDLRKALEKKSYFLLGPRAVGKSSLIEHCFPDVKKFDLLDDDVFTRLLKRPRQLGEESQGHDLIIIDEIQKLPKLLDEVHRLIEKEKKIFLLTGSSVRKLKRGGANLLAGRARSINLFPLTSQEIPNFNLLTYLNRGGIPLIYLSDEPWTDLKEYVQSYLKEEIFAEALIRKIDHFAKFLDVIGLCSGQEMNLSQIASDAGVPARSIANFIEILMDTLVAFQLQPFQKTKKRKASTKSKIYLFDIGVANYLSGRKEIVEKSDAFGQAFEHFIIQEIRAFLSYEKRDETLSYWRSKDFEVDLIIGDQLAIEIKSTEQVTERHLKGLLALKEEKIIKNYILVSQDPIRRKITGIELVPYAQFLKDPKAFLTSS